MMMPRNAGFRSSRLPLIALVALLGIGTESAVRAATFPDLFTVTVVPGPAATDRRAEAERLGMAQLLTRITGRREAETAPELGHLIQGARSYVIRFGSLDRERVLVGFNSNVVDELTRLNWPVWGAERPLTLLWIAVDFGDGQRALLGETPALGEWTPEFARLLLDLREQIDTVARERGLPVAYPLLDLQDLSTISFAEVWGGFDSLIQEASARYGADAALLGRVSVSSLGLDVRWTLVEEGRSRAVLGTDVGGGLEWLADQYAAEYSSVGGVRNARISVLDVTSLEDYGRVISHLESLSVLQSVDVEGFDGDTLNLRVAARGDDRVVERLLTLGGILVPSTGLPGSPLDGSLVFRIARSAVEAGPAAEE